MQKSGFVSIIGYPNSGKSTLFNSLLGEELSAVTVKPQTTRNKLTGILTKDGKQIVFLDTPGHLKPSYKLQEYMEKEIAESLKDTDIILILIDANDINIAKLRSLYIFFQKSLKDKKIFLVLNKIDLLKKQDVLVKLDNISKAVVFDEIIPVSAKKKFNVDALLELIFRYLPEHEFYFEPEQLTDKSERFFIAEMIRAQVLKILREELPYSVFIEINEFKERENDMIYISCNVILEREAHKKIMLGSEGKTIKLIGQLSRADIEKFLGKKVYLDLRVKVVKDWKNNDSFLRRNFLRS